MRIDVDGSVVDVKNGLLVERVCVEVVGCVLLLKGACVVSVAPLPAVVAADEAFVVEVVDGGVTGTDIFALIMCTSALGCDAEEMSD